MKGTPTLLVLLLAGCVRTPDSSPVQREDESIQFPNFHERFAITVGKPGDIYNLDGVTLRAINVVADDFIPPDSKELPCWRKREAHSFRIIRQGDIIFVSVSTTPGYCRLGYGLLDYGAKYAVRTDGRILRRWLGGPGEDLFSPPLTDAGEPDSAYAVDPSLVGSTLLGRQPPPDAGMDGGSSPPDAGLGTPAGAPRAELELQDIQYDGENLSGRLLIGAAGGRLRLDKRLIENVSVNVHSVRECATGLPPTYVHADSFPPPPREKDLLVLEPGSWYGARIHLWLFSQAHGHPGPDCIDVGLTIDDAEHQPLGMLTVRATRSPQKTP